MLEDFLKYQAKTTPHPLGLEIEHASGSYLYDTKGKSYLDFIAGVSALPIGTFTSESGQCPQVANRKIHACDGLR